MPSPDPRKWTFDIDRFINPFVPPPPWQYLPYPVAYLFGYRREKPGSIGTILPVVWAFIGIFIALSVIELASERIPSFVERGAPIIVASFVCSLVITKLEVIDANIFRVRVLFLSFTLSNLPSRNRATSLAVN